MPSQKEVQSLRQFLDKPVDPQLARHIRNGTGNPQARFRFLAGRAEKQGLLAWFGEQDLIATRQWFGEAARLHRMAYELERTPLPRRAMDWEGFWSPAGPAHWQGLRAELTATQGPHQLPAATPGAGEAQWRRLYFPELKRELFAAVDASEVDGPAPTPQTIAAVIKNHVDLGLRGLALRTGP